MFDRHLTRRELRDKITAYAATRGVALSPSRADKIANKWKRGYYGHNDIPPADLTA